MREGTATIAAAELAPSRFLVAVGGVLDAEACAALRDVLTPLAGADGARIVLDLANVTSCDGGALPALLGAGAVAGSTGGSLTVVTSDARLRDGLETDGSVTVAGRLEERLL